MSDAIVPDDKDWTWVLERPCPECGFDAPAASAFDVAGMIRQNAGDWEVVLDQPADVLRERTDPARWTTLEYAAHVRDVYRLYRERLELMIDTDDPLFANGSGRALAGAVMARRSRSTRSPDTSSTIPSTTFGTSRGRSRVARWPRGRASRQAS